MILGKHTVFPYRNAIHEKVDSVFCVIFRTLIRSGERHVVSREIYVSVFALTYRFMWKSEEFLCIIE